MARERAAAVAEPVAKEKAVEHRVAMVNKDGREVSVKHMHVAAWEAMGYALKEE